MTASQPIASRCASPNSALAGPIEQVHYSRYLETRQKALELFARCGFSQVSMRELAAHIGITPGAIYHHVESKEALLFEWLMELYQTLLSHVELIKKRRLTPAQRLTKLIEGHLRLHEHMAGQFKLAVMDTGCLNAPMEARVR